MLIKSLYLVFLQPIICNISNSQYCNDWNDKRLVYKLVKVDSYSKQSVLTRKQVSSVNKCKEFAAEKRALAFNYGRYEPGELNIDSPSDFLTADPYNVNCILLICPEINNFTALAKVKGFNYYSVYYKKIWLGGNRTLSCVPSAGLFTISDDQLNYTDARKSCQNLNASLAHIANEIRTEHLAHLIGNYSSAFVGLSSDKEDRIWKNECNESLSCFNYRAWGDGQPTRSHGCTALARLGPNSIPFWQVVPCKRQLHYICEISPVYNQFSNSTNDTVLPNCSPVNAGRLWEVFIS